MARVRQFFNREELEEPEGELKRLLEEKNLPIKKGSRIAITCGSRGIDGYVPLLKTIVAFVKEKGGIPFLVPSMGSHGGPTARGHELVMDMYDTTQENIAEPVFSNNDVDQNGPPGQ